MKLTNKANLPDVIMRALKNDKYDKGDSDYTASGLVRPPQMVGLEHIHGDEITDDAADRLWSLFGQLGHTLLERAGGKNEITEKRYFGKVGKYKISAQVDSLCLESGTLTDWKMTSVWGFIEGKPPKEDWVVQMNIQAEILRQNDIWVEALQIVGLLRDWQKRDVYKRQGYPKTQIKATQIPLWESERTLDFIRGRIEEYEEAKKGNWRECTQDERYKGDARCHGYCQVSKWCQQYLKTLPI